jgi:hypothetical protein
MGSGLAAPVPSPRADHPDLACRRPHNPPPLSPPMGIVASAHLPHVGARQSRSSLHTSHPRPEVPLPTRPVPFLPRAQRFLHSPTPPLTTLCFNLRRCQLPHPAPFYSNTSTPGFAFVAAAFSPNAPGVDGGRIETPLLPWLGACQPHSLIQLHPLPSVLSFNPACFPPQCPGAECGRIETPLLPRVGACQSHP